MIFFILLLLLFTFSNSDAQDRLNVYVGHGFYNQENLKLSYTGENLSDKTGTDFDIFTSSIISRDNKYYFSINPVFILLAFIPIDIGHSNPLLWPQWLTNFKFSFNFTQNKLNLLLGQSTDYFSFYDNFKVYTETLLGLKFTMKKIELLLDLRKPWTIGYRNNTDPYINFGVAIAIYEKK